MANHTGSRPVVGQMTHPGLAREANEDAFGWFSVPAGELLVVADGMGGQAGGAEAARAAVAAFHEYAASALEEPENILRRAVWAADRAVSGIGRLNPELAGLGSTIAALLIQAGEAFYIHAGDSRIYHLSGGRLAQLTRDHSYVRDLVEAGRLTEAEAAGHEDLHIVTQSLGGHLDEARLTVGRAACRPGDLFLLCTDGLWGAAPEAAIRKILAGAGSPQVLAKKLVELALQAGGPDNVTVQLAAFPAPGRVTQTLPGGGAGERPRLLAVVFILGLLGGVLGAYVWLGWPDLFIGETPPAVAPAGAAPEAGPPEPPPASPPQRPGEL